MTSRSQNESPRPTEAELDILRVHWERGDCTVREVHDSLYGGDGAGYTTALKLMQIMHVKGLVGTRRLAASPCLPRCSKQAAHTEAFHGRDGAAPVQRFAIATRAARTRRSSARNARRTASDPRTAQPHRHGESRRMSAVLADLIPWIDAIGRSLRHFFWQGVLESDSSALSLRPLCTSIAARYRLGMATLLLMLVAPMLTLAWLRPAAEASGRPDRFRRFDRRACDRRCGRCGDVELARRNGAGRRRCPGLSRSGSSAYA